MIARPTFAAAMTLLVAGGCRHTLPRAPEASAAHTMSRADESYDAIGGGHSVKQVGANGRYIVLEDGSRWEVAVRAQYVSADWQPSTTIAVRRSKIEEGFPYELIDTDDDEAVPARYVGKTM